MSSYPQSGNSAGGGGGRGGGGGEETEHHFSTLTVSFWNDFTQSAAQWSPFHPRKSGFEQVQLSLVSVAGLKSEVVHRLPEATAAVCVTLNLKITS